MGKWICRHCGGEIEAEVSISSTISFGIDEDGDITEPNTGFTVDEMVRDCAEIFYYKCTECGIETESSSYDDLTDIAEWVDDK